MFCCWKVLHLKSPLTQTIITAFLQILFTFPTGSFGEIHLTHDTKTGEIFATKLVLKENPNAKLRYEYELYQKLGNLSYANFTLTNNL